mmetsp:Transcript_18074/g.45289  ORF Transcript_18074/g.45289 Transcript_18074/m.45289 type:complete len:416 (-) Transcript_18074:118-1365(-)|eukprot:g4720.t1
MDDDDFDDLFDIDEQDGDKFVNPSAVLSAADDFDGDRLDSLARVALKGTNHPAARPAAAGPGGASLLAGATRETLLPTIEEEEEFGLGGPDAKRRKQSGSGVGLLGPVGGSSSSSSAVLPNGIGNHQVGGSVSSSARNAAAANTAPTLFSGYGKLAPPKSAGTSNHRPTAKRKNDKNRAEQQAEAEPASPSAPERDPAKLQLVTTEAPDNFALGNLNAIVQTAGIRRPVNVVPMIHNCVSSFQLQCTINLEEAVCKARNMEYNPKKAPSLIVRHREPRATALVYESGRVMITGARSPDEAKLAGKKIAKLFQAIGYKEARFACYSLENLIAIADVGFPIRLEGLACDYRQEASYEPEMFSGCVWKMSGAAETTVSSTLSVLIFVSGKLVLTGAKDTDDLYKALDDLYPKLFHYQK